MLCYVDTSVVLRKFFRQPHELKEWNQISQFFSSRILRLEVMRSIDRWRIRMRPESGVVSLKFSEFSSLMEAFGLLPLTDHVLRLAEQPTPTPVATLDSIHLATALLWKEKHGDDFFFATHDQELGLAARVHGLNVIGLQ